MDETSITDAGLANLTEDHRDILSTPARMAEVGDVVKEIPSNEFLIGTGPGFT